MRKIIRYIWNAFLILISIILWGNEFLILILASLACTYIIGEFIFERINIRNGKYLAIKNEQKNIFPSILWVVPGILFILSGFLSKNFGISFKGINSNVFLGIYFFILGVIRFLSRKTTVLLTDKHIVTEGDFGKEECSYRKLDKVVLRENEIILKKRYETESLPLVDINSEEINKIFHFLLPKLENRIIKE